MIILSCAWIFSTRISFLFVLAYELFFIILSFWSIRIFLINFLDIFIEYIFFIIIRTFINFLYDLLSSLSYFFINSRRILLINFFFYNFNIIEGFNNTLFIFFIFFINSYQLNIFFNSIERIFITFVKSSLLLGFWGVN